MFYWGNPIFFWSMLLLVPGIILSLYAQFRVKSTFKKYSQTRAVSGVTGAQASRRLLDRAGRSGVAISEGPGNLTGNDDGGDRGGGGGRVCMSGEGVRRRKGPPGNGRRKRRAG